MDSPGRCPAWSLGNGERRVSSWRKSAGVRGSVEECFQTDKSQVGLDHYQVRNWTCWHRHITPSMLALAFLTAVAASTAPNRRSDPHRPPPAAAIRSP